MVELCRHRYHEGYTEEGDHALVCSICGEIIPLPDHDTDYDEED